MHVREIIGSHREVGGVVGDTLVRCIELCFDCGQTCTSCVDASVSEPSIEALRQTIRTCSDCADICLATGVMAGRRTGNNIEVIRRMLEVCMLACGVCAAECEKHAAHHEHHRICGEVCRLCEAACRDFLISLSPSEPAWDDDGGAIPSAHVPTARQPDHRTS